MNGFVLGGYRIERELGRGGMGIVYRATQLALDRSVALKLIAPEIAADATFRRRFEKEAKIAASLTNPHVLPVYEAGERDGYLFISMRLVEGPDLGDVLRSEGPLAPARASALIAQVADGLDAAFAHGLVHRDVKPSNVLIERTNGGHEHAFLVDFGLAKTVAITTSLTETQTLVGTLDYVSPEQIEGRVLDARSDVYALGCVLYECLTGHVPFDRPGVLEKIYAHIRDDPPRLPGPGLVPLDHVVRRAMAKAPEDRYDSAGALARAALEAADRSGRVGRPKQLRLKPAWRLPAFAALGLGLVGGASLLAVALVRGPATSPRPAGYRPPAAATPTNHGRQVSYVQATGTAFDPHGRWARQGATVKWSFQGPGVHGVEDSSGMNLFRSGRQAASSVFAFRFTAAGHYPYADPNDRSIAGTIRIPLDIRPGSGRQTRPFDVIWASGPLPGGFVEDVQVRRPGASYVDWLIGQTRRSATFTPDGGTGTYVFRARLRRLSNGAHSQYSARPITVTG